MSTTLRIIEIAGVVAGMASSVLFAGDSVRRRASGFVTWIGSNIALIIWALSVGAWALAAMYIFYCCASVFGLWNNRSTEKHIK